MPMTQAELVVVDLYQRCNEIIDGKGSQEDIDNLMMEVEGGYSFPLRITNSSSIVRDRTINGVRKLRGWLGFHLQNTTVGAGQTNITTNATSSASANSSITVNQTISQIWQMNDSVLTNDEKEELTQLLNELDKSSKEEHSKVKKAARSVGDWLFDKAIEAVPTVMPFVMQAIQNIGQ